MNKQQTMDYHFNLMVLLMLFFYSVWVVVQLSTSNGWIQAEIGKELARDSYTAYLTLQGIAIGMFRGMASDSQVPVKVVAQEPKSDAKE